jgi:hypothetical protein
MWAGKAAASTDTRSRDIPPMVCTSISCSPPTADLREAEEEVLSRDATRTLGICNDFAHINLLFLVFVLSRFVIRLHVTLSSYT